MSKYTKIALTIFITICALLIYNVQALTTESSDAVEQVYSEDEFLNSINSLDESNELILEKDIDDFSSDEINNFFTTEVIDDAKDTNIETAVQNSDLYEVVDDTDEDISIISIYGGKQILVDKKLTDLYGAESGTTYNNETILQFEDENTTKEAYDALAKKYGEENVLVDFPVEIETKGWGTEYMNIPAKIRKNTDQGLSKNKVVVAVIDSGINRSHEIFKGKTIHKASKSFVDSSINDLNGHGTATAGVIAESTNNNVSIMVLKVVSKDGSSSSITVTKAIEYAVQNGADVINISLGGSLHDIFRDYYENKMKNLTKNGAVIVASMGNDGIYTTAQFPASLNSTISVGSVDSSGKRSSFSNFSPKLDFVAPGENILAAKKVTKSSYARFNGTSLSAPYVSACCATIKQVDKTINLDRMRYHLKCISIDKGTKGKDNYYGWGIPRFGVYKNQLKSNMLKLSSSSVQYTGKKAYPKITINDTGKILSTKYYNVSYPKGNVSMGTKQVKISGKNGYIGSITKNYKIVPKTPVLKIQKKSGKYKISWSKTGKKYQLQVVSNYWKNDTKTYNLTSTSNTVSQIYKTRVRSISSANGETLYSPWSAWKTYIY